jgi:hypothetical protein
VRIWAIRTALVVAIGVLATAAALAFPAWAPVLAGFLLGVIGAGAGAVLEAMILEQRQRRSVLRALLTEIDENLIRLQPPKPEGLDHGVVTPDAPALDSAWLQARSLELTDTQRTALGRAYSFASSYNGELVLLNARLAARGGHLEADEIMILNNLNFAANRAIKAFETARDAMRAG